MPAQAFSKSSPAKSPSSKSGENPDHIILFQEYFKSPGPRTYVAQVKKAKNGNHFIMLTEGKRDEKTNEVRKTRLVVFSEDFPAFFKLMKQTAEFVKANPVSEKVRARQQRHWQKKQSEPRPRPELQPA